MFVKIKVKPGKDDYYWCEVFKIPNFGADVNLVQFEVLLQKENIDFVHHVQVNECDPDFERTNKTAQECGDVLLEDYVASKCTNKILFKWVNS